MKTISIVLFILFISVCHAQIDQTGNKTNDYLAGANLISVTIGGKFIVTGTFPASISERADQFITHIFNQAVDKLKT